MTDNLTTEPKTTAFHVHEILHGTVLVQDLLEAVFSYQSGYLVTRDFPQVRTAAETAQKALADLYQVVGGIDIPEAKET